MVAIGAALSLLSLWLAIVVIVVGFVVVGCRQMRVRRFTPISLTRAMDRLEATPGPLHALVRVRLVDDPVEWKVETWSDVGGLLIEPDRLVYASPSTAWAVSGQDLESDYEGRGFQLMQHRRAGWFMLDVLPVEGQTDEQIAEFQANLTAFLAAKPWTQQPRQLPPIRAFGDEG